MLVQEFEMLLDCFQLIKAFSNLFKACKNWSDQELRNMEGIAQTYTPIPPPKTLINT